MKTISSKAILAALALLLLIPVCRWVILPQLEKMDDDFSYSANIFSVDNLYDEKEKRFSGEVLSVTKFSYNAIKKDDDGDLIIKNVFDVRKPSGEKIFAVERLYGVNPTTGAHVHGKGDRDRKGFLFAPKNIANKEDFTYWHINYNTPALMKFQGEADIAGLKVYHYSAAFKADQTENLTFLPGVPKERGVELDVILQTWIDPITGSLIKYEDHATAWYYDIHTHKRLHPWNKFHNACAESSILHQVGQAKSTQQTINWIKIYLPVAFALIALLIVAFALFNKKYTKELVPAFVAVLILTVGIGTSLLFHYSNRNSQYEKQLEEFEVIADKALSYIKSELDLSKLTLEVLRFDYQKSGSIDRKNFAQLSRYLMKKSGNMQAFGYAPVVRSGERKVYEERARNDGYPNFQFTETNSNGELVKAPERDYYVPVYFIEPYQGNQEALGYNLTSDSIRMNTLALATQTGEMAATAPSPLVQVKEHNKTGIIIYNPLFADDDVTHKNVVGYFSGVYRIDNMINSALSSHDVNKEMKLSIVDATTGDKQQIYSSVDTIFANGLSITKQLPILNRVWEFQFYLPSAATSRNEIAFIFLGIFLTVTIAILMYRILGSKTKALTRQTALYENLLKAQSEMGEGVSIVEGARFVFVNDGLCKIYGYTREELLAMPSFLDIVAPESRDWVAGRLRQRFSEGGDVSDHGEITVIHKDGHRINIAYSLKMMESGGHRQIFNIIRDITDRKQNEEALVSKTSQLLEAQELAHIGSWEWDVLTNKIVWSDELYRIYGLSPQEFEASYENFLKYIHPDDRDYVNGIVQKAFNDHQPFHFFHKLIHRDGTTRVLEARGHVFTDSNGNTIRMSGTAHDVTDVKLVESYRKSAIESSIDPFFPAGDEDQRAVKDPKEISGIQIEKLIPAYSEEERQEVMTYLAINKKYNETINVGLRKELETHPIWGPIISQMSEEMMKANNEKSWKLQEGAVIEGKWVPYIEDLIQQGVMYAKMGIDFKDWLDIISLARKFIVPIIQQEFHATPEKVISTLWGMDLFMDTALSILGEAYIEEKRQIINAQKIASAEQMQVSQYSRSLIEASLDPLVTISANGKITDVNEASVNVTGVPRERLIGTDFTTYFTEPEKAQEGYRKVFEKGFVADYPLTIKHINGRLTDVLYNASVYKDDAGNVLGVFAAARDITAQKQLAEKELMRMEELERFRQLTVGRELKMVELKKEIDELKRNVL